MENYDNTLIETDSDDSENGKTKDKDLINKSSDLTVRLSKKTNQKKFVRIEKDGYKISWYFVNANKVEAKIKESKKTGDGSLS